MCARSGSAHVCQRRLSLMIEAEHSVRHAADREAIGDTGLQGDGA